MIPLKKIVSPVIRKFLSKPGTPEELRAGLEDLVIRLLQAERRACIDALCFTCSCGQAPRRGKHEWIHDTGGGPFCCPASKVWELSSGDS